MSAPILLVLRILLAVSLYAFLIVGFVILWRDVRQQNALLTGRRVPLISLSIQRAQSPILLRHFAQSDITIGRDPACECSLQDETISARHARLSYHHSQWWLEDLNSTNGTLLNHEKLLMPTVVTDDDRINCGKTTLTISLSAKAINPPTRPLRPMEN